MLTWTQEIDLRWRPNLGFYEQRTDLLRMLEAAGSLKAFTWSDQEIGAKLENHAELRVRASSATLRILSPRIVVAEIRRTLLGVLEKLQPEEVTVDSFLVQCLVPLSGPLSALTAATGNVMVPELPPDGRVTDWAMLADGESNSLGSWFQVEYGIIDDTDAALRLTRQHSRVGWPGYSPSLLDEAELPECAFFLDWTWLLRTRLADDVPGSLTATWDNVLTETWALSKKLQARLGLAEATLINKEA